MTKNSDVGSKDIKEVKKISIRFAGDSGDGVQLTGDRFATLSAIMGNDVVTLADYPAEIRAPAGTLYGVSGYQLSIGVSDVYTPGDKVDVLVAFNPAALKINLDGLKKDGILIVNKDAFNKKNLNKSEYDVNPLEDDSLAGYRVVEIELTKLIRETLIDTTLKIKDQDRCKNFLALGLTCWLFHRDLKPTLSWIDDKFKGNKEVANANKLALNAGYNLGHNLEIFPHSYTIPSDFSHLEPGYYRYISGNKATALGLIAASANAKKKVFLGSYPITPASDILNELSKLKEFPLFTFQAEDEIAAIGAAIGAAFAGELGVTSTSGPGMALKSEFLNLAVMTELPLVVINVQRGGPSTGLPTKMEQADLLQGMWGRNGESPIVVLASSSPSDCFEVAYEACRIAMKYMVPVLMLSDGYLANGSEGWKIPEVKDLKTFEDAEFKGNTEDFSPYKRNEKTLARQWAFPGMKGLEHRIGGLEKEDITGKVTQDAENHQKMVDLRAEKVQRVQNEIPEMEIYGKGKKLLVIGWGSSFGAIRQAVRNSLESGVEVAQCHLRFISPLPADLGDIISRYDKILIPEINSGQLALILQAKLGQKMETYNKIKGVPFEVAEIENKIREMA